MRNIRSILAIRPSPSLILLMIFLLAVWFAGGASRPDALGQAVVRAASAITMIAALLLGVRPSFADTRPVLILLLCCVGLALLQLIPLPPAIWQSLPGREALVEAAAASGQAQPWRPLSIVPGATANAAFSLIVPATALFLVSGLQEQEKTWLPTIVLCLIIVSSLVGLLQFSGAALNNPFVNDTPGQVSGTFANRNHMALFLALGCVVAPVWAFQNGRSKGRGALAFGVVLFLGLMILAIGSRAGLAVGAIGIALGILIVRKAIRREVRHAPRWVLPALVIGGMATVATFVLLSIAVDRAEALDRVLADDMTEGLRGEAFPIISRMINVYFPAGTGLGSFDPLFRMHEPFDFLSLKYFNHAHNDFLEIILDAGLPGAVLLASALIWMILAGVRAWRVGSGVEQALPQLGSVMLLLIAIASLFDYPARTPIIMVMTVVAGVWLSAAPKGRSVALPTTA